MDPTIVQLGKVSLKQFEYFIFYHGFRIIDHLGKVSLIQFEYFSWLVSSGICGLMLKLHNLRLNQGFLYYTG